jgi:hypothetical protein
MSPDFICEGVHVRAKKGVKAAIKRARRLAGREGELVNPLKIVLDTSSLRGINDLAPARIDAL